MILDRWGEWINDRMNPVSLRELRQAMRGKFITSMILIFLLVLLSFTWVFIDSNASRIGRGNRLFTMYLFTLLFGGMILAPLYAGVRIAAERGADQLDLVFVTTLKPSKIILGKLFGTSIVAALLFSVSLPFFILAPLLRGIDGSMVLLGLFWSFFAVLAMIQAAICLGTLNVSRMYKSFLGLGFLVLAFFLWLSWGALLTEFLLKDVRFQSNRNLLVILFICILFLAMIGGFFVLSVAQISPMSSNRAKVPRIYFTLLWLISLVGTMVLADQKDVLVWAIFATMFTVCAVPVVICERESIGFSLQADLPKQRWRRILTFPFHVGAVSGLMWIAFLFLVSFACLLIWDPDPGDRDVLEVCFGVGLFALAYGLAANTVRFLWFRNKVRPALTWWFILGLLSLGVALPWLLTFLIGSGDLDHWRQLKALHLFNPTLLENDSFRQNLIYIAALVILISCGLLWRWFRNGLRPFIAKTRLEAVEGDP